MKALTRKEALAMGEDVKPLSRSDAFLHGTDLPSMNRKEEAMKERGGSSPTPSPEPLRRFCTLSVLNSTRYSHTVRVYSVDGIVQLESEIKANSSTEAIIPIPYDFEYDWSNYTHRYPVVIEYLPPDNTVEESYIDYNIPGQSGRQVNLIKTYGNNNYMIAQVQDGVVIYLELSAVDT